MIAPLRSPPPRIPPTLSAREAGDVHWHAAIVGAGPAGAATALRFARRGLRVILLDAAAMPRPKVCGCCLSTMAMAELHSLGVIAEHGPVAPRPLRAVTLAAKGRTATMPMPAGGVLSREALDAGLVAEAIAAGAAWLPETRVVSINDASGSHADVLIRGGRHDDDPRPVSLHAGMAVVASGLEQAIRIPTAASRERRRSADSRVGLGTTLPPAAPGPEAGRLVMAVSRRGYCGIVRLEDGRVDVAAAVDHSAVGSGAGPAEVIAGILADACGPSHADGWMADLLEATFRGTPRLTHASPPVATPSGRVLRIGDAAAYVEPFTGEGIGWALATARLLDDATAPVAGGSIDPVAVGGRYAAAHAEHFARHHARCRRVSRIVRRPRLVACAAGLARFAPATAARLVPLVIGGLPQRRLPK